MMRLPCDNPEILKIPILTIPRRKLSTLPGKMPARAESC